MKKAIVITDGVFDTNYAKTAHGLIRGSDRFDITAVIDKKFGGIDAGVLLDGKNRNIPIWRVEKGHSAHNRQDAYKPIKTIGKRRIYKQKSICSCTTKSRVFYNGERYDSNSNNRDNPKLWT